MTVSDIRRYKCDVGTFPLRRIAENSKSPCTFASSKQLSICFCIATDLMEITRRQLIVGAITNVHRLSEIN